MKNSTYIHGNYPAPRPNQVGLFYFLWLGEHGRHKPYDVSKITAEHPDAGYQSGQTNYLQDTSGRLVICRKQFAKTDFPQQNNK